MFFHKTLIDTKVYYELENMFQGMREREFKQAETDWAEHSVSACLHCHGWRYVRDAARTLQNSRSQIFPTGISAGQ